MTTQRITCYGFTLSELMTTLAVMGVLATVAIPSFISLIAENRLTTNANQLISALAFARSEALKRGIQVTIKRKETIPKVWENGWDIFTDSNGNGEIDVSDSDELLMTYAALPEGFTLRTGANYANWVAYLGTGKFRSSSGFANDTFRLCDSTADKDRSRGIIIKMGRVRTEANKVSQCP